MQMKNHWPRRQAGLRKYCPRFYLCRNQSSHRWISRTFFSFTASSRPSASWSCILNVISPFSWFTIYILDTCTFAGPAQILPCCKNTSPYERLQTEVFLSLLPKCIHTDLPKTLLPRNWVRKASKPTYIYKPLLLWSVSLIHQTICVWLTGSWGYSRHRGHKDKQDPRGFYSPRDRHRNQRWQPRVEEAYIEICTWHHGNTHRIYPPGQ